MIFTRSDPKLKDNLQLLYKFCLPRSFVSTKLYFTSLGCRFFGSKTEYPIYKVSTPINIREKKKNVDVSVQTPKSISSNGLKLLCLEFLLWTFKEEVKYTLTSF